jgi:hypothetical protein
MIPGIVSILTKLKAFVDNFNRANNPSSLLGASSPTNKWIAFRGTWGINSNKANTATAANTYPMAGIKTGAKTARVKITNGTSGHCGYGLAFWILDSNNWYGLVSDRTYNQTSYQYQFEYPCDYSYQQCGCGITQGQPYSQCGGCGSSPIWGGDPRHGCASCGCGGCSTFLSGPVGTGCPPGSFLVSSNYNGNGQDECAVCGTFSGVGVIGTCSGTTTCRETRTGYIDNYLYFANLIRMSAGSVSLINSRHLGTTQSVGTNVTNLQIETNATATNSVRTSASLDAGAPSTAVVAINGAVQTGVHGIAIAPVTPGANSSTQATSVDDFDYTPL